MRHFGQAGTQVLHEKAQLVSTGPSSVFLKHVKKLRVKATNCAGKGKQIKTSSEKFEAEKFSKKNGKKC